MRKLLVGLFLMIATQPIFSQSLIDGMIRSSDNQELIAGTHILNLSNNKLAFSSEEGVFKIFADIGDTLSFSHIGFEGKLIVIKHLKLQSITLTPKAIQLEEVRVSNLPENEYQFKRRLLQLEVVDSEPFVPFGVTPAQPKGKIPKLYERASGFVWGADENFWPSVTMPISVLTKKFSKKHKAKRDYYELKASKEQLIMNDKEYNKTIISNLTGLEGEELMSFMSFLNFDQSFVKQATSYEIAKAVLDLYKEYKLQSKED